MEEDDAMVIENVGVEGPVDQFGAGWERWAWQQEPVRVRCVLTAGLGMCRGWLSPNPPREGLGDSP